MNTYIGVDEVGRGALAGPLVACAARILDEEHFPFTRVKDSKALTDTERRALVPVLQQCCEYSFGIVSNHLIDRIGIQAANVLAFDLALRVFPRDIQAQADHVGGFKNYTSSTRNIVFHKQGESKFPEIAAASILAKVFRDDLMIELHREYPRYFFDQHKGYGTSLHVAALKEIGVSPVHRLSFNLSSR